MSLLEALLRVLLGLTVAGVAGAAVGRAFTRGLTLCERVGWSLAAGLLVQEICLVVLLAAGLRPRAASLLAAGAVVAGAAWLLTRGASRREAADSLPSAGGRARLVAGVLIAVAFVAWAIFLVGAAAEPMWTTDFLAFWGYRARVVFLTSEIPRRLFEDPALYFAHPEYPLLVPFSLTVLAGWVGEWNDHALALLYPVCAAATLLVIFGFLARRVSLLSGAAATALASLCFFLYRPINAGTAEVPFALSLVLLVTAALDFLARRDVAGAWRLAVGSLFCAALKEEGTLFVVLVAITVFSRLRSSDSRAGRRAAAALLGPVLAHAALLYLVRGSPTSRDFDFTLFEPRRWAELPSLFLLAVGRCVRIGWTEALVPILAVLVFYLATRRGIGEPLLPVFPAQIFFYAVAFTVSSFGPLYAIDGAFRRIAMTLFPAFTIVLCARIGLFTDSRGGFPAGRRTLPTT